MSMQECVSLRRCRELGAQSVSPGLKGSAKPVDHIRRRRWHCNHGLTYGRRGNASAGRNGQHIVASFGNQNGVFPLR